MSLLAAIRALGDMKCPRCGKRSAVLNANALIGGTVYKPERVTPETHCACRGGPAAGMAICQCAPCVLESRAGAGQP